MSKFRYLIRSIVGQFDPSSNICPNCGSSDNEILDRKSLVTSLKRCTSCRLMFRYPADNVKRNEMFYNNDYVEGQTTSIPDDALLSEMLDVGFQCDWNDYQTYIQSLKKFGVGEGSRVFDFGCSWGYGSYQLRKAGYDVYSYDIAVERRQFGVDRLGVRLVDNPDAIVEGHPLYNSFDCFFSAHVMEHVPTPAKVIDLAWRCLKPGGAFVAFIPNGTSAYRKKQPASWSAMWGDVHPNFLDDEFFVHQFQNLDPVFFAREGESIDNYYELGVMVRK